MKITIWNLILCISLSLSLSNCKKPDQRVTPCINADQLVYVVNKPIGFSDCSGSAINYLREWDFGEGQTATGINIDHTYTSPGYYTITLTISTNSQLYSTSVHDSVIMVNNTDFAGTYSVKESTINSDSITTNVAYYNATITSNGTSNITVHNFKNMGYAITGITNSDDVAFAPQTIGGNTISGSGNLNASSKDLTMVYTTSFDVDTSTRHILLFTRLH